jgi:hypothetical protein
MEEKIQSDENIAHVSREGDRFDTVTMTSRLQHFRAWLSPDTVDQRRVIDGERFKGDDSILDRIGRHFCAQLNEPSSGYKTHTPRISRHMSDTRSATCFAEGRERISGATGHLYAVNLVPRSALLMMARRARGVNRTARRGGSARGLHQRPSV